MTAEKCAEMIVRAMEKRDRLLITSARARLGRALRLFLPGLVDRLAAREIAKGSRKIGIDS